MDTNESTPELVSAVPGEDVHHQIGHLTRQLHNTLNELGYADSLKGAVGELPDAKSRLNYIARLTGEAAEKVLHQVEQAKARQDALAQAAGHIVEAIKKDPVAAVAKGLVLNFANEVQQSTQAVDQHLTEIMMAQDFHDLTGQVIKRVVSLTSTIEDQLIRLLILTAPASSVISAAPAPAKPASDELAGPVVDGGASGDVVTDQSQVDDLLASLGF